MLAVVLFHADVPGVGGGFVGVDVFFVISGFLITGLLWREVSSTGTVRLRGFYGARARRLLPASATVGVVTMIASAVLLPPLQVRTSSRTASPARCMSATTGSLCKASTTSAATVPPSPFQHYWSLGVEEQFYLVWPPLIIGTAWLIRHVRRRTKADATSSTSPYLVVLALVAAVSFALSLVITYVMPAVAFFSLPTRAWQLAAGGLVALTAGQWRRLPPRAAALIGWVGLGVILWGCNQLSATTLYPGIAALLPMLGAALVIGAGCATPTQGCGRVLGLPPMRAIGRVSYSWYLWHWPALLLAPALLGHPLGLAGRLAAALALRRAGGAHPRLIENPLRFAAPRAPLARAQSRARRCRHRGRGLRGRGAAAMVPTPVGRGPAATPLTITAAPPPAGSNIDAYDAAVQQGSRRCRPRSRHRLTSEPYPSNLDPPLADAAAEQQLGSFDGCLRGFFQVRTARMRDRRHRLDDHGGPGRRLALPRCGVRRSSRSPHNGTGGWRR